MKHNTANQYTATILTIAGSDPFGGAGIQADCKTIHALGGYALSVATALTSQNSLGVESVYTPPVEVFKSQLNCLLDDIKIDALKIGMLSSLENVQTVIELIQQYSLKNIVLDPVLISTSGHRLLNPDAIALLTEKLFPLTTLITPNIPEALLLTKQEKLDQLTEKNLLKLAPNILLKGGHNTNSKQATDTLYQNNRAVKTFQANWVKTNHTHGTGCVLSSAIATQLALGNPLNQAIQQAKEYLSQQLNQSNQLKLSYHNQSNQRREPIKQP